MFKNNYSSKLKKLYPENVDVIFVTSTNCSLWMCRVEKEKNSLKSELDDLSSQLDHISKTKVKSQIGYLRKILTRKKRSVNIIINDYCDLSISIPSTSHKCHDC